MKNDIKILLLCIIVLLLIIVPGIMIKSYLQNTTSLFSSQINNTQEYIKRDNWKEANHTITSLSQKWEKTEDSWALLINHHEMDNISSNLMQVSAYIESKDKSAALAYLASLKHYIDHIPEMETLSLKNIF